MRMECLAMDDVWVLIPVEIWGTRVHGLHCCKVGICNIVSKGKVTEHFCGVACIVEADVAP